MRRVHFLSTGGTLGMTVTGDGALAPSDVARDVLAYVRDLEREVDVDVETLCNLDSSDLGPETWDALAEAIGTKMADYDGFVIVHGTDTMAWTACALAFALQGLRKPVVLTGAQRPIALVRTDAPENLVHAALCATLDVPEVGIYFGRRLYRGCRTTKTSIHSYQAFDSPNLPPLLEMGVGVTRITPPREPNGPFHVVRGFDPRVEVVWVVPGSDATLLTSAADRGARAVVVCGFGSGNVPRRHWPEAIRGATDAGVVVVMHSACEHGAVDLGAYEGGRAARDAGAVGSGGMTLEATTVKLMHLVAQGDGAREAITKDLAGEGA